MVSERVEVWGWVMRQMMDEDKSITLHGVGKGEVSVSGGVELGGEADER